MSRKYPRIGSTKRKPDKEMDGSKNYGLPCVVCETSTCGQKWVQVSYMRGDDELIRVCDEHWKLEDETLLALSGY